MKTLPEIMEIVGQCEYLDWDIRLRLDGGIGEGAPGYRPYVQIFGNGPNPKNNNEIEGWSGRKWFISPHMCTNEIVRTCYKAIHCAVLHEMNEMFLYKEQAVFTPHMDYDEIASIMKVRSLIDARDNGMQGV